MCDYFKNHFQSHLDENQFGCTASRSTTLALIKFSHYLFTSMDRLDSFGRILFIDFSKAFDLIDHNILFKKFHDANFPPLTTVWFLSFLYNRSQFVSINSSLSGYQVINAGTPQGTLSGPNNFKLLINDLSFDLDYIKYVDDVSVASVSCDLLHDSLLQAADHLLE